MKQSEMKNPFTSRFSGFFAFAQNYNITQNTIKFSLSVYHKCQKEYSS